MLCTLLASGFVSCESDDDEKPWVEPVVTTGAYILNNGSWHGNNASLSYYDFETDQLTERVFANVNSKDLGDTAEDMLIYGSKMYITVTESNVVFVTDLSGKIINTIAPLDADSKPDLPRYLAAAGGKVYVTLYSGHVARIDTTSCNIEAKAKVGAFPEEIAVSNNKLFVANSGYGSGNTVSVIDLNKFEEEATAIEVRSNPMRIKANSQGDVYVISAGDFETIPSVLQKINVGTNKVDSITTASKMAINGSTIYVIDSQYLGKQEKTKLRTYNMKNNKVDDKSFIGSDGDLNIDEISCMSVNPANGDMYIFKSSYVANGDVYIYSSEGEFKKRFDTGGINPMGAFFLTSK
ncbi:hypothetical protein D0T56_06710 [Dysgonomonas sp. 520]|nr:hypothetical protein [Dysgonomonas sp. 520]